MNPVYCLQCNSQLDWDKGLWSMGPEIRKVHFMCGTCGWWTQVECVTVEHVMRNLANTMKE